LRYAVLCAGAVVGSYLVSVAIQAYRRCFR
jgi:hypothetical protein